VISGLQAIWIPNAFQTQAARPGFPSLALPVVNADTTQAGVFPGAVASLYGQNLVAGNVQVTLNDIPVTVQFAGANQINFIVPANFPTGPATLRLNNGLVSAYPVLVQINEAPPVIVDASTASNTSGDVLNVLVTGLPQWVAVNPSRLRVTAGGIDLPAPQVSSLANGVVQLQFPLKQTFSASPVSIQVWVDGSAAAPFLLTIR